MTDLELTVKQAARELSVSERTVRRWLQTGKLRGRKVDRTGGQKPLTEWRIDPVSVQQAKASGLGRPMAAPTEADALAEEVRLLRQQNAEFMTVIGQLVVRIADLEASVQKALPPPSEEKKKSWWQKLRGQ